MGYSYGSLIASMHPGSIQIGSQDIAVHRLLLSYPYSVRGFLTLFNTYKYKSALSDLLRKGNVRTLIVYGTNDQFTSASTYSKWVRELKTILAGDDNALQRLTTHPIEDADHFWHGNSINQLCDLVEGWLVDYA